MSVGREVHLELLLGREVRARNGRRIGRLEEVRGGEHEQVLEFLVGEGALLERLAALGIFRWRKKGYAIRWDQLDWSDLEKLRLKCGVEELTKL